MAHDLRRLEAIFNAVLTASGPMERAKILARECGDNAKLRAHVERLIAAHEAAPGSFLPIPECTATGDLPSSDAEGAGTVIGPYKLLQVIGEGGFGTIFMAEQEHPVRRRVALKIIKLGMDTKHVIVRFEAERQALALMDHPNVAKVFDAGTTPLGRPYFVMELVKGVPITQYCDQHHLSVRKRMELFVQLCHACQHAHQKGVIHRDIKPSNVLVATQDDQPLAKVIDFGVAKAIETPLTEKTLFTRFGQWIGTPEYMSPEQAEGSLDIDTRSDVYSLGVLLYELLAGSPPLAASELRGRAFGEIQRIIREVDPPRPSARISGSAELAALAECRGRIAPGRLPTEIRGELDWIVMRCLEKDRARRYQSASAIAADLLHYLADEPVQACPPSAGYRLRKFARRHRAAVLSATIVVAVLIAGIIGTTIGFIGQRRQRFIAERQRAIAEAVEAFQADMLAAADPNGVLGSNVTVVQAVLAAARELDKGKMKDQPEIEASIRLNIGTTLRVLGEYDAAEPHLRKALELRRRIPPLSRLDLAAALNGVATLWESQNKLADAEPLFREALNITRTAPDVEPVRLAACINNLGHLLYGQRKLTEAEAHYREALAISRHSFSSGHPAIAAALTNIGVVLRDQRRLSEAEVLFREALEMRRASLPANHPLTASSLSNLATVLQELDRLAEAEPLLKEAVEMMRRTLPAGHPSLATVLENLGMLFQAEEKLAEAEIALREALDIRRQVWHEPHPELAHAISNLAMVLQDQGKYPEAEALFREAVAMGRAVYPADHPVLATILNNLGGLLWEEDHLDEAEALLKEALKIRRQALPPDHPHIANTLSNLGWLLKSEKKFQQAEAMLREALGIQVTLETLDGLAQTVQAQGRLPEAETYYRQGVAFRKEHQLDVAPGLINLAYLVQAQGQDAEAESLTRQALEIFRHTKPPGHPDIASVLNALAVIILKQDRATEAEPLLRESIGIHEKVLPKDHWKIAVSRAALGRALRLLDRPAEAEEALLAAERILAQAPGAPPDGYPNCLKSLVRLYESWEQSEPGKGYAAKAEHWQARLSRSTPGSQPARPVDSQ